MTIELKFVVLLSSQRHVPRSGSDLQFQFPELVECHVEYLVSPRPRGRA